MKKLQIFSCFDHSTEYLTILFSLCQEKFITFKCCENLLENSLENKEKVFEIFYNQPFQIFKKYLVEIDVDCFKNLAKESNYVRTFRKKFIQKIREFHKIDSDILKFEFKKKRYCMNINDIVCHKSLEQQLITFTDLSKFITRDFCKILIVEETGISNSILMKVLLNEWAYDKWKSEKT